MKKMMSPNTKIVWVDADAVVDPLKPTLTELNAGIDISCAITRGYTLNPTNSDTDDSASICDEGNVETPTYDNYEASLTLFNEENGDDQESIYLIANELFERKGALGYLYRRIGKKSKEPFVATDTVEGFYVLSDNPQTIEGDSGGPIQTTVPFFQQGLHIPKGTPVLAGAGG